MNEDQLRVDIEPRVSLGDSNAQLTAWMREEVIVPQDRWITEKDVLESAFPNPYLGQDLLVALEASTDPLVIRMVKWLHADSREGLNIGSPVVQAAVLAMVPDTLTQEQADALNAMGSVSMKRCESLEYSDMDDASWHYWFEQARAVA